MIKPRWLLVEDCAGSVHRLYLTPEGQPSLCVLHPRESALPMSALSTELILARLAQQPTPACVVVAVWLARHTEIANPWGAYLYQSARGDFGPKHVRLCVRCGEPIPQLFLGYTTGRHFCSDDCRAWARRSGTTAHDYRWPFKRRYSPRLSH